MGSPRMAEPDEVVDLGLPWLPDPGSPELVVLQTERDATLIYGATVVTGHEGEFVVLQFPRCLASRFGYPNDEALVSHPLYRRGLSHYGIFEVLRPSWLEGLRDQNRVGHLIETSQGVRFVISQ